MAADAWKFYNQARKLIGNGTIKLDVDSFKIALFLFTSNCATATLNNLADLTNEHASANGYARKALSPTWTQSTATVKFDVDDQVWVASGGSIVCRYAVIFDDTPVTPLKPLLCWCLLDNAPADITVTNGNTLTVTINASGVFDLTGA